MFKYKLQSLLHSKNKFEKLKCILCNQLVDQESDHKCSSRNNNNIKVTRL